MSSVSVSNRALAARPLNALQQRPTSNPPPPPVDFSTIDTPQKAALVPALTLPIQYVMANTMYQAGQNGYGFRATVQEQFGGNTKSQISYDMPDPSTGVVNVGGQLGNTQLKETWNIAADGSITINGTIGNTVEKVVSQVQQDGSTHLDGTIGNIPFHIIIQDNPQQYGMNFYAQGTVGGQNFAESDRSTDATHLQSVGQLGNVNTLLQDTIVSNSGTSATLYGAGELAGTDFQFRQDMAFVPSSNPNPPNPPDPDPGPDPDPSPDPPPPWPDPPDPNGGDDGGDDDGGDDS